MLTTPWAYTHLDNVHFLDGILGRHLDLLLRLMMKPFFFFAVFILQDHDVAFQIVPLLVRQHDVFQRRLIHSLFLIFPQPEHLL